MIDSQELLAQSRSHCRTALVKQMENDLRKHCDSEMEFDAALKLLVSARFHPHPQPHGAFIDLRPVDTLCGGSSIAPEGFRIPDYQRGYRWRKNDVIRLLEDLKEFLDEDAGTSSRPFYCLQPLVVKQPAAFAERGSAIHSEWEVVDGQQRLTTLFLIIRYLTGASPFSLSYATRDRSKNYLESLNGDEKGDNIDFHHIYNAHDAVAKWFDDKPNEKDRFRILLKNSDCEGRNVRFIWYQLSPDDDAVEVFTRLNVGKIPLSDEELIRALFLRNPEGGKLAAGAFQHRLALEWDRIETALQDPAFWAFLSSKSGPEGGRIRLLFELCGPKDLQNNEQGLFLHYENELAKATPEKLRDVWQHIVTYFERLEEWWQDSELFHLIGFVTTILTDDSIAELRTLVDESAKTSKSAFKSGLRGRIRERLIGGNGKQIVEFLDELDYSNTQPIRRSIALFNIATLLRTNDANLRFPFDRYHGDTWDIEHVRSQAGENLKRPEDQAEWLKLCKTELEAEAGLNGTVEEKTADHLLKQIGLLQDNMPGAPTFEVLSTKILEHFGEAYQTEGLHNIGNLTLLDATTNRAYKNAPFAVKRSTILAREKEGTLILPCTRDLFLKCYSEKPGNLRRWTPEDGEAHETVILHTMEQFFAKEGELQS